MRYIRKKTNQIINQGFSLVETLLAAVVMMGLLIGTNKLVMQGMAASSQAQEKFDIEKEIMNDIEHIQSVDSALNNNIQQKDADGNEQESTLQQACNSTKSSSEYLKGEINTRSEWVDSEELRREIQIINPSLLLVTYTITAQGKNRPEERRRIELNPSYETSCRLIA